jgi:hypothetical protein
MRWKDVKGGWYDTDTTELLIKNLVIYCDYSEILYIDYSYEQPSKLGLMNLLRV